MRETLERRPPLPVRAVKNLGKALEERSPKVFVPMTIIGGVGTAASIHQGDITFIAIDSIGTVLCVGLTVTGIRDRLSPSKPEAPKRIIYLHRKNKKRRQERKKLRH